MTGDGDDRSIQAAARREQPPGMPPAPPGAGPGPPAGADPVAYRGRLLKAHLRAANAAYRAALAAGAVDPVVVIAELADPRTARFPDALRRDPGFPRPAAASAATGRGVIVFAAERARTRAALQDLTTAADDALEAWQPGTYLAVAAGAGGLTFSLVSLPPRGRGDEPGD
jgi:hypothetical protein